MKSMTGFGKAEATLDGRCLTVELKSVNHRFLDISMRLPRMFMAYEDLIRSCLSTSLNRGHIDVYVNYEDKSDRAKTVKIDLALAKGYVSAANVLQKELNLKNDFKVNSLLKTQDIVSVEATEEDPQTIKDLVQEATQKAVVQLEQMRTEEGAKLKIVLSTLVDNIEALVKKVIELAPIVVEDYRKKLTDRIAEALKNVEIDQSKLANEVAFFVDKANIDEETARLTGHISHIRQIMDLQEPIGKKLDFLVQEFNREANTVCSKSNNLDLTNVALSLKNEIEKVREQIQNVE